MGEREGGEVETGEAERGREGPESGDDDKRSKEDQRSCVAATMKTNVRVREKFK